MNTSEFLALLIGVTIIPIALGMIFNRQSLVNTLQSMLESPGLLYLSGIITLVAGTAMIVTHNIWMADWPVIITVFGWLAAVKGALLILLPKFVSRYSEYVLNKKALFPIVGVIYLGLGILLVLKVCL